MKQFLYIALLCTLTVSCELDEYPKDQIPEEEAYATKQSLFQNTVATLYNYTGGSSDGQGLQGTCRGIYDLQTFGSDEAILPTRGIDWYDNGMWQAMYKHSWTPGHDLLNNSWKYLYKVITLCNNSLEQLSRHSTLAGDDLEMWQAEVRALRALYYWYLIDLFGDVPLILSTATSMKEVHSTPRKEVYQFIVNELQTARRHLLISSSTQHGSAYGRITRPVSDFIMAKLMLNAPVYTGSANDSCYQQCIDYCDSIEAFGYNLSLTYSDNFSKNNETSVENIFVIPMDKDLYTNCQENIIRSLHYRHAASWGMKGENGACATLETLRIYGYGTDDVDSRFFDNFYTDNIYTPDGRYVTTRTGQPFSYVPEAIQLDLSNSPYLETAGARMHKYQLTTTTTNDGKLTDNDIVLFRFADVLLMRAEAKVRLGESGQEDFDRVRERADMERRPCTLENLLDERMLELCWEGWRRQDLIRFGKYRSLYDGPDAIDESDGHTTVFPIPGDVRTLNPNIPQNKGY